MIREEPQSTRGKGRGTSVSPGSGFVLPAAIFLLGVLGGLAAWLMQLTTVTLAQEALELVGARAYQAAQAGLEAGIYAARTNGTCATQAIALTGALSGFTASVTCASYTADEAGTEFTLFEITSIACNQPTAGACPNPTPTLGEYAERRMRATVESGS